jgi:uncharacterized membrane protein
MTAPHRSGTTLRILTAVVLAGLIASALVPGIRLPMIVAQVAFALVHGAQRYGWRAIGIFIVAGLMISNMLENLSIATGFPFGHYHYTGAGQDLPGAVVHRPGLPGHRQPRPGSSPPCCSMCDAPRRG